MDFEDLPDDAAFRARARDWLEKNCSLLPDVPTGLLTGHDDDEIGRARVMQAELAAAGLAGLTWPREYGGQDAPVMHEVIFNEEAKKFDLPLDLFMIGTGLVGPTIIVHGTEEQKKSYLGPILRGEAMWCQLFSEPDAGSDLASLRTRAVRDGDEWVVTGQKVWTSGAHYSDFGFLIARTDPSAPKHRGLTCFLVDMHTPGIVVRPLRQMTGDAHFNEVFLDAVRIPDGRVLGEVNGGWSVTNTLLMNERTTTMDVGVEWSGLASLARGISIDGRPATEIPSVRQAIADIYIRQDLLRFTHYRLLTALSTGRTPGPEGSISKLATAQLLKRATNFAMALQGAGAMVGAGEGDDRSAWQKLFLYAPAMRILGGTDEIQRNIISERVLGMPREPDPTRGQPFDTGVGAE